jgi:hypothetical protein
MPEELEASDGEASIGVLTNELSAYRRGNGTLCALV